jgi:general secretion pathway protein D
MNKGIKQRLPLMMTICLVVLCSGFVSGCMSGTYENQPTIDEKISRNRVRVSTNTTPFGSIPSAEPVQQAPQPPQAPEAPSGNHPVSDPPPKITPDESWEHLADAGILGLDNPVRRHLSTPLPDTTLTLDLAFDNADLTEVLDLILYEHYNLKYMMDPSINAKLTFHIHGEYSTAEILAELNSILHVSGVAIVEGIGSILKIVTKGDSARSGSFELDDVKGMGRIGDVTRMVRTRYLNAVDFAKTLSFFVSKNAQIIPDQVHNSIIITDTPENIEKIASIIDVMDVPFFQDISWKIFPVYQAKAETIATELVSVFKTNGLFTRPGMTNGSYYISPVKTINGILVVTRWPEIIDTIGTWIKIMDQVDEESSDVFVYYVENGNAKDLTEIMKQVYGAKVVKDATTGSQKIVSAREGDQPEAGSPKTPSAPAVEQKITGELENDIIVIADDANNAIIFKANPRDYVIIRKLLDKLDIMPRQVLLNVVVAEVTLQDSFELGVQWKLNAGIGDYTAVGMGDNQNSKISIDTGLGTLNGFSLGLFNAADALKALVRAVGGDSKLNILSSPNIIGLDNKEAKIEVTTEVPVISGSQVQSDGTVTNTVEYKTTGIILTATPYINSRGLVKLDLVQEVSEVGSFDQNTKNYPILTRKATTSLVVENEQTIFIGGMMRENTSTSDIGIPVLKDIPGLGYLFKQKKNEGEKTELIFLITPHVIQSRSEADAITREFTEKISQVKKLIEN